MFVLLTVYSSLFKSTFLWIFVLTQLQMLVKSMDCVVGLLMCFPIEDPFLAFCPIILGGANQKMLCVCFFVCVVKRKLSQIQWTMAMGDGNGQWHWAMAMISQQLGLPDYSGRWWVGVQLNWLMDMSCPDWCWTNRNYWHQGQASSSRIGSSDLK